MRVIAPPLFLALSVAVTTPARAGDECHKVKGKFESMPSETCNSPVGMCTTGALSGRLRGDYGFVMNQVIEHNEDSIQSVAFFTGLSTIETKKGVLLGTDAGSIDLMPFGHGAFTTLITITGGKGGYRGATGYLQVRGRLDFATGGASGDYQGLLCTR